MSVYAFGPFRLDEEQLSLTHDGDPVSLGPKVVATLLALVERPGAVVTKSALLDRIWPDSFVEEANLAQNIHVLRRMFRTHGSVDPIETVRRRGYRFTASVQRLASDVSGAPAIAPAAASQAVRSPARTRLSRRLAGVIAATASVAAALVVAATSSAGHHGPTSTALRDEGARSYQIGRYYWDLRTRESVRRSAVYFSRVVDADPHSARGYAALADANLAMGDYCYGTHRPEVYFARAHDYAQRALALDPHSAGAHAVLGFLALYRDDATVAMSELRRAIALDPAYGPAHEWYGIALIRRDRVAEGVAHLKIAADLDPLSVATFAWLGSAAYRERRFGDAIAYSQQALELSPQRNDVLATLGAAYEARGDFDQAIAVFKRYGGGYRYYRPESAALLAHAYALGRRYAQARTQLDYARAHASEVDPTDLAAATAALHGERRPLPERRMHHRSLYA